MKYKDTAFMALLDELKADLPHLNSQLTGGDPAYPPTKKEWRDEVNTIGDKIAIINGYVTFGPSPFQKDICASLSKASHKMYEAFKLLPEDESGLTSTGLIADNESKWEIYRLLREADLALNDAIDVMRYEEAECLYLAIPVAACKKKKEADAFVTDDYDYAREYVDDDHADIDYSIIEPEFNENGYISNNFNPNDMGENLQILGDWTDAVIYRVSAAWGIAHRNARVSCAAVEGDPEAHAETVYDIDVWALFKEELDAAEEEYRQILEDEGIDGGYDPHDPDAAYDARKEREAEEGRE